MIHCKQTNLKFFLEDIWDWIHLEISVRGLQEQNEMNKAYKHSILIRDIWELFTVLIEIE